MHSEQYGNQIIKKIKEWSKEKPEKLVVAIDGLPGVGKTTISNYIASQMSEVVLIHIDDFMTPLEFRSNEVPKHDDPTDFFLHNWFEYDDIRTFIENYKKGIFDTYKTLAYRKGTRSEETDFDFQKPIMLFEGVLLYQPNIIDDIWDKRIYLDGDEEEITKRRIEREKAIWGEKYIPETDPRSWHHFMHKSFLKYQSESKPKQKADLLLHVDEN